MTSLSLCFFVYYVIANRQQKTQLDLELNLFDNSFANKSLTGPVPSNINDASSLASSAQGSKNLVLSNPSVVLSLPEKPQHNDTQSHDLGPTIPTASTSVDVQEASARGETSLTTRSLTSSGSNKHNLRILNLPDHANGRTSGLMPPIFSPGGRKLPHFHLLPGLGSPSSSNLWSSLLNVTNGLDSVNSHSHPGYGHLAGMSRKLGLIPTESNMRIGLTPSIINQTGFNFNLNTPGGMPSEQLTPGFQTLLGLANNASMTDAGITENHPPFSAQPPTAPQVPQAHPTITTPLPIAPNQLRFAIADPVPPVQKATLEESPQSHNKSALSDPLLRKEPVEQEKTMPKPNAKRSNRSQDQNDNDVPVLTKFRAGSKTKASKATKAFSKLDENDKNKLSESETEEEKRRKALERNRVAATKCRQRKKRLFNKMESELEFYSTGFRELSLQVSQLRDQLLSLHGIMTCHIDCPSLLRAVGGYQQMQAILAQSEYVALLVPTPDTNIISMPSSIPTTLNSVDPPLRTLAGTSIISPGAPVGTLGRPMSHITTQTIHSLPNQQNMLNGSNLSIRGSQGLPNQNGQNMQNVYPIPNGIPAIMQNNN